MRRYEPVSSGFLGGTAPSIFGTTFAPDKSLSAKLQKKKEVSCQYSSHHLALYKSFCPNLLQSLLIDLKTVAAPSSSSSSSSSSSIVGMNRSFFGTCLIIDLSGFTKLSADLCDQGATGIDELRQVISLYFGNFVDIITSMGGDVMYFAGDSLITIFHNKHIESIETKDVDITSIAVHCANKIHNFCVKNNRLSAHAAIEYGEINFSIIGGYLNQWVYLVAGKCINSIGNCLNEAGANQTVISESAYFQVTDPSIEVEKLPSGRYLVVTSTSSTATRSKSMFHTFSFTHPIASISSPNSSPPPPSQHSTPQRNGSISEDLQSSFTNFKIKFKMAQISCPQQPPPPLTESQTIALASHIINFIPRPVLEGISLNLLNQLSELRTVTTLFLKIENFDFKNSKDLTSIHQFFYCMQECLADSGGYLRQFLFDDKGCVLIALWGIPSASYANNCSRALRCAVVMTHQAKQFGYLLSIGISTGSIYCGTIGSSNIRQDYVALGKSVNLSARLMCKANGRILLDEKTFRFLPLDIATLFITALPSFDIKGFTDLFKIFWYSSNNLPPFVIRDTPADSSLVFEKYISEHLEVIYSYLASLSPIVCSRESVNDSRLNSSEPSRAEDQQTSSGEISPKYLVSEIIPSRNLLFGKRPYFFAIYGSPGIGKTALVTYLSRKYKCMGFNVTFVRASPNDELIHFNILKKILIGLISLINENTFGNDLQIQKEVITLILKKAFPSEDLIAIKRNRFPSLQQVLKLTWELPSVASLMQMNSPTSSSSSSFPSLSPSSSSSSSSPLSFSNSRGGEHKIPDQSLTISIIIRTIVEMIKGNGSSGNVVIIDNAHFMCSSTWAELVKLVTLHCPLLIILTFRVYENKNNWLQKRNHERRRESNSQNEGGSNVNTTTSIGRCASTFVMATLNRRQLDQHGGENIEIVRHSKDHQILLSKLSPLNSSSLFLKHLNYQSILKIFHKTFPSFDNFSNLLNSPAEGSAAHESSHVLPIVNSLYLLSQGIPFWIWKIIKFMKSSGGDPLINFDYKSFICYLLDKFTETEKNIIKCASVVGTEFHIDVLKRMIAPFLLPELEEILFALVDDGLINQVHHKLFIFRSSIVREYIYALIPPSDAASLHLLAADTIEIIHCNDLTLFTPSLSYHYSMSQTYSSQSKAWHYTLRAAILCLNSNLFHESIFYLKNLLHFKLSSKNKTAILFVVDIGIEKMKQFVGTTNYNNNNNENENNESNENKNQKNEDKEEDQFHNSITASSFPSPSLSCSLTLLYQIRNQLMNSPHETLFQQFLSIVFSKKYNRVTPINSLLLRA